MGEKHNPLDVLNSWKRMTNFICVYVYIFKKKLMKMIYYNKIFRAYLQLIVVMTSKRSYVGVKSHIRVFSCSFFAEDVEVFIIRILDPAKFVSRTNNFRFLIA